MPVAIRFGKDEVKQTADQKEAELAASKSYINRNKRRHVFLTPPEQLKDILLGIHMYHTAIPDVFEEDQTPQVTKVGAQIEQEYMTEDEKNKLEADEKLAKLQKLRMEEESKRNENFEQEPTALQRLRHIHNTKGKFKSSLQRTDLLSMIQESETRIMRARTGISFVQDLAPRTLDETIEWALSFVTANEESLLDAFFQMDQQITQFAAERKLMLEKFRALHRRAPLDKDEMARFYIDYMGIDSQATDLSPRRRDRTESSPTSSTTSFSTVGSLKGPSADPGGHGKNGRRRSSVRLESVDLLSPRSPSPPTNGRPQKQAHAHSSMNANHAGGVVYATLARRLEHMKEQGQEAFIRGIAPPKTTARRSSSVGQGGVGGRRRPSLKEAAEGVQVRAAIVNQWQNGSAPAPILEVPPKQETNGAHTSNNETATNDREQTKTPSSDTAAQAAHRMEVKMRKEVQIQQESEFDRKKAETYKQRSSNTKSAEAATAVIVYNNTAERSDAGANAATAAATAAANLHLKTYQTELANALQTHAENARKLEISCNKVDRKANRMKSTSQRVCTSLSVFDSLVGREVGRLQQKVDDMAFLYPAAMESKMENMKLDNHHFMRDIKVMEAKVRGMHNFKCFESLLEAKWLLDFLPKLKELIKRNPVVSMCAIKFLGIIHHILMLGWGPLTPEIFYKCLECTVTTNEDYARSMVHRIVSCVRDVVNISPEAYLKYLQRRGITPSPELTAEIQVRRKKRRAAKKTGGARKSFLGAIHEGMVQSSQNAEQNPELDTTQYIDLVSSLGSARMAASRAGSDAGIDSLGDDETESRYSSPCTTRPSSRA